MQVRKHDRMSAGRVVKVILIVFVVGLLVGGLKAIDLYRKAFAANIFVNGTKEIYFFVKTGSTYEEVFADLKNDGVLKNPRNFDWTAKRKNYPSHINPGRYLIKNRMSNNDLVNMLRSGKQDAVMLTFNNINTIKDFSDRVAEQLEFSSESLMKLLSDQAILEEYGFSNYTIPAMFIPNTYELYWNITPSRFLNRMNEEYNSFWISKRKAKAKKIGMTQEEVITLASIVNKEVRFDDEKKRYDDGARK